MKKYYSGNQLSLLLRKGVYPYDYVDCLKKLDEESLPPKEAFYSKLTGESITYEDYQHAHTVWKEFNIESMKNYHKLYNLFDVLLLADIFEKFRSICMNHYDWDPAWYFSAPGPAWDATLKTTKVQLELLRDPDKGVGRKKFRGRLTFLGPQRPYWYARYVKYCHCGKMG